MPGTQGSEAVTAVIQQLGVYIANLFFLTSDTLAPVYKDSELDSEMAGLHYGWDGGYTSLV